jgi:hypothetical protein
MSVISHKLDQKEVSQGKGKAEGANRAEQKKLAAAAAGGDAQPATEGGAGEGEGAKKSKKELKKEAKKE